MEKQIWVDSNFRVRYYLINGVVWVNFADLEGMMDDYVRKVYKDHPPVDYKMQTIGGEEFRCIKLDQLMFLYADMEQFFGYADAKSGLSRWQIDFNRDALKELRKFVRELLKQSVLNSFTQ